MKIHRYINYFLLCICFMLPSINVSAKDAGTFVNIKSDAVNSIYYAEGTAICRILNRTKMVHNLHCSVMAEPYSYEDISQLEERDTKLFIINHNSWDQVFNNDKVAPLRTILNLPNDLFFILAKKSTNITSISALLTSQADILVVDTPVNRLLAQKLLVGYPYKNTKVTYTTDNFQNFCASKYSVLIVTEGYPSYPLNQILTECDAEVLPIDSTTLHTLTSLRPYLTADKIASNAYLGILSSKPTVGVRVVLASHQDMDENKVYQIAHTVATNYKMFNTSSPALIRQTVEQGFSNNHTIALHKGSRKAALEAASNNNAVSNNTTATSNSTTTISDVSTKPTIILNANDNATQLEHHEEDDIVDALSKTKEQASQTIEKYNIDVSNEE